MTPSAIPGVLARLLGSASVVLGAPDEELSKAVLAEADPTPFLASRKARKLMGLQDELAVVAVGHALSRAGLVAPLGDRAGLYLAAGAIPFLESDLAPVLAGSIEDGAFSARRFGAEGSQRAHPFLTFRCLPNMPAYHVSASFGLTGPYVVAYPGGGQLGLVLEEALAALAGGRVDTAVVLGVTHARNFLVEQGYAKLSPPVAAVSLRDAAACLILRRAEASNAALPGLRSFSVGYAPVDLEAGEPALRDETIVVDGVSRDTAELGPASLPDALHRAFAASARHVHHRLRARDGILVDDVWSAGETPWGAA